jgi:hypothetical protein
MNQSIPFGFPTGRSLRVLLPGVLLALAFPAWASLGDNVTTVQSDKVRMKGSSRSVATEHYVKHEITTPSGQVVREFVSSDGQVFGVAWQGQFQPDLQQLLGSYSGPIKQALAAQQRRGHGPVSVETSGFVFRQAGNARNLHGSAFVPAMVPQGVDVSEIQ